MAKKPQTEGETSAKLPPIFGQFDDPEGGSAIARLEIFRLQPNGRASVGEAPLDVTSDADLIQFVRENDHAHGRTGGVYLMLGKKEDGAYVKGASHRFRVDRDPSYVPPNSASSPAPAAGDAAALMMTTLVSTLDAQSRAYEARVRADMAAREQQSRLDAERRERDQLAQLTRERAYYDQQRERDRELSDQARERDRAMYGFLLEARGGGEDSIGNLMAGIALAQELQGGDGGRTSFGDKLIERLGGRFLNKLGPEGKRKGAAKVSEKKKNAAPVDDEQDDDDDEQAKFAEMLETLLLNVDEDAAAGVLKSMITRGKLTREVVGELAAGKLDMGLDYDAETLDKLHKAADTAYRATGNGAGKTT